MPKFHIRAWREQILVDSCDYVVEADTLEAATRILADLQDEARDHDGPAKHPAVNKTVYELDPDEVADSTTGYTLTDAEGRDVRDLIAVPFDRQRLGEPLEVDWS